MHNPQKTIIVPAGAPPKPRAVPVIPDHALLQQIGRGSYGEVWLAKNVMGTYRAIKIVYRDSFDDERPYEREFAGIKKYEPLSRSHEGLMDVLQIGRNDGAGYFYYVMELGDDQDAGQNIAPETYSARTLWSDLRKRGRSSFNECLRLGSVLSSALGYLHQTGLIHRDIKPANIIFVNGLPKLADIGLVTEASEARTFVGTEGYIPPEGPGAAQADIYSLGKVLYEIATGQDRLEFPNWPSELNAGSDGAALNEFNAIIQKACASNSHKRYKTCEELHADLVLLESGKSVKHLRALEMRLRLFTTFGVIAAVAVTVGVATYHWFVTQGERQARTENRLLAQRVQAEKKAKEEAEHARLEAERDIYYRNIAFAQSSWAANNIKQANEILESCPERLRNWEWFYLKRLCHAGLLTFHGHTNGVSSLAFRSDSHQIASADTKGKIKIWNPSAGEVVNEIHAFNGKIDAIAYSPNGQDVLAVSAWTPSAHEQVKRFSVATGEASVVLDSVGPKPASLAFDANGHQLAAGDETGLLRLWNLRPEANPANALIREIATGTNPVQCIAFSPDGQRIATGAHVEAKTGEIKLWDISSGQCLLTLSNLPSPFCVAFSPDGQHLAGGLAVLTHRDSFMLRLDHGQVKVWDSHSGEELQSFQSHWGGIQDLAFSPDGKRLAIACGTGTAFTPIKHPGFITRSALPAEIIVCDLESEEELIALRGHIDDVSKLAFSPDGERLVSASLDDTVKIWNPTIGQNTFTFSENDDNFFDAARPALSSDLRFLAVPEKGKVVVWDIAGSKTNSILLTSGDESLVAFGPEQRLASAGADHHVRFWNAANGRELSQFAFDKNALATKIAYSPNGRHIALALNGTALTVFEPNGHELFRDRENEITSLVFSEDNKFLAVGTRDGHAVILKARTGEKIVTLAASGGNIDALAFSHDKRWIATAGWGPKADELTGAATIWDAVTGKPIVHIPKTGTFFSLAFSPNDQRLATSTIEWPNTSSGEINLWDIDGNLRDTGGGQEIFQLSAAAVELAFSADGRKLVAVDVNGTVRVWNAEEVK